jgi:hypothetical protein
MSEIEFIVVGVIGVAALILSIYNCIKHSRTDDDISFLRQDLCNKTSDTMYEFERKHRREIQEELEALKEYLDVEAVAPEHKVKMRSKK